MAYEQYRRWIILGFPGIGGGPVLDLIAGSFAGGTAVLFTYPLDLVRTKLAYQVKETYWNNSFFTPYQIKEEKKAYVVDSRQMTQSSNICSPLKENKIELLHHIS